MIAIAINAIVVLLVGFSPVAGAAGVSAGAAGVSAAGASVGASAGVSAGVSAGAASLPPMANVLKPGVVDSYNKLVPSSPVFDVGSPFHLLSAYLYNTTSLSPTLLLVSHDFGTLKLIVIFEASESARLLFVSCRYWYTFAAALVVNGFEVKLWTFTDGLVTEFFTSITIDITAILSFFTVTVPLEPAAKLSHEVPVDAAVLLGVAAPPPPPLEEDAAAATAAAAALVVKENVPANVPLVLQFPLKSHTDTLK